VRGAHVGRNRLMNRRHEEPDRLGVAELASDVELSMSYRDDDVLVTLVRHHTTKFVVVVKVGDPTASASTAVGIVAG